MTTKLIDDITFVKTITTTPILVNPVAVTFNPNTVTAHLDMVRAQLERLALDRKLPAAFLENGRLTPELQTTDLGQQFEKLSHQAAVAGQIRDGLVTGLKAGGTILLIGGAGATARYIHRRGWLMPLARRAGRLASSAGGKLGRMRPFRRGGKSAFTRPATDLPAFTADLARAGMTVTVQALTGSGQALETVAGPLALDSSARFVVVHERGNFIFTPEEIASITTLLQADHMPETQITVVVKTPQAGKER